MNAENAEWLFCYALTLVGWLYIVFGAGDWIGIGAVIDGYPPLFIGLDPLVTAWLLDWDESDLT